MNSSRDGSTSFHGKAFSLLLAYRLVNALTIKTFFQPDEYFQALEPAWELAFGPQAKAWITWEWHQRLRSSLHPFIFSAVYVAIGNLAELLSLSAPNRSALLIAAPKVAQAIIATCTDYFTWRLGARLFGDRSAAASTTLLLTVLSPWQRFCSTRTFSNSLEVALTAFTLSNWPWDGELSRPPAGQPSVNRSNRRRELALALTAAAAACILRPTNLLIWACVASMFLFRATNSDRLRLVVHAVGYGSLVLAVSMFFDRAYYGEWTIPALRFLGINVGQSVASFYGRNRLDYYLTEGIPLLLTAALPFAGVGIISALKSSQVGSTVQESVRNQALKTLSYTCLLVTAAFSTIPHKEVRFLYPLLPLFIILATPSVVSFLRRAKDHTGFRAAAALLLALDVGIAIYTTQVHQRGVVDVVHFLRQEHELRGLAVRPSLTASIGFLMPCHSTPWRSHLVYPNIDAWALTCEPPIDIPEEMRTEYLDEADQFYEDPSGWLSSHMADEQSPSSKSAPDHADRRWPEYLVFFEQLEDQLVPFKRDLGYVTRRRFFNTHWHDDWRRRGDVVVWQRSRPALDRVTGPE